MTAYLSTPDTPEPFNGHRSPGPARIARPANLATRHLCAVTHMRTHMLTDQSFESDDMEPPRRWVGRAYALRVLVDRQRTGPMPGVDLEEVRRQCRRVIRQTLIRDAAALAALATAACLAPWGTLIVLGLIAAVIVLAGRVKVASPLIIAAAAGIALALISGGPQGGDPLIYPLAALGICFLIYTADSFLAARRVRAALKEPAPVMDHGSAPDAGGTELWDFNGDARGGTARADPAQISFSGHADDRKSSPRRRWSTALYDKDGIIGAGTPLGPATFTVAVNKPRKDEQIKPFKAADLLEWITSHIESQGTVNHSRNGFAHRYAYVHGKRLPLNIPAPLPSGGRARNLVSSDEYEAFTYGLPELDVNDVDVTPAPWPRFRPFWWILATYLFSSVRISHRNSQAVDTPAGGPAGNDSPSAFPGRHYVRASTATWDGELVASVYVSAVLQAHYLRLIVRPYVLAPMVPHLAQIDYMADRNALVQFCLAVSGTVRTFARAAVAAHNLTFRRTRKKTEKFKMRSTRERYALPLPENVHHNEDASRILDVIEMKIFNVTEEYLEDHNIDTEDYKRQIQIFVENSMVITGGQNSGNFSMGNNNRQQSSPAGSGEGQGSGK